LFTHRAGDKIKVKAACDHVIGKSLDLIGSISLACF